MRLLEFGLMQTAHYVSHPFVQKEVYGTNSLYACPTYVSKNRVCLILAVRNNKLLSVTIILSRKIIKLRLITKVNKIVHNMSACINMCII